MRRWGRHFRDSLGPLSEDRQCKSTSSGVEIAKATVRVGKVSAVETATGVHQEHAASTCGVI